MVYRPPEYGNLSEFFEKLSRVVDLAITKYNNVVVLGDINVDTQDSNSPGLNKVQDLCDVFGLKNLIKSTTCETKTSTSSIDITLTNGTRSFKNSGTIETGLSDFHKLVMTSFRSIYERLRPTKIQYRSYKKFNEADFLKDITDALFDKCLKIRDSEVAYDSFKDTFISITNKHAPLKTKMIRGNQAPFKTKELSKQIMIRSRLRNKFNKHKTREHRKTMHASETNA